MLSTVKCCLPSHVDLVAMAQRLADSPARFRVQRFMTLGSNTEITRDLKLPAVVIKGGARYVCNER
jgi:hypothetical protein